MNDDENKKLADVTRGMIQSDIEQTVEKFLQFRELPAPPDHATNTCDPYTGNWAEHLMDPYLLASILGKDRFHARILPGYYGNFKDLKKRFIGKKLDFIICKVRVAVVTDKLGQIFS